MSKEDLRKAKRKVTSIHVLWSKENINVTVSFDGDYPNLTIEDFSSELNYYSKTDAVMREVVIRKLIYRHGIIPVLTPLL